MKMTSKSYKVISKGSWIMKVKKNIGGHKNKTWTDLGALRYLAKKINAKTFLDIGCGPGGQIEIAKTLGLKAQGIDGDPKFSDMKDISVFDFSESKFSKNKLKNIPKEGFFDIGWSVEFLEHVDEKYIDNFMPAFSLCRFVVITHATPGQGGYHHVNENTFEYWENIFKKSGFSYSSKLTKKIKEKSTMKKKKMNHFLGFNSDGQPINEKKISSFMLKNGCVFYNEKIK